MSKDINWNLVTEDIVWESEKIYDSNMNLVTKDQMDEEQEYIIF